MRGVARALTPYELDHLGVSAALEAMIEAVDETTEIVVHDEVDDIDGLLPKESEINLYRIVQEALNNLVRHSGAAAATVRIRREGEVIRLTVEDDGRGFAVRRDAEGRVAGGFGLSGMAERVRILDGRIEVESGVGRGTRVEVVVPVRGGGERAGRPDGNADPVEHPTSS
ncbi:MAG: sensor histidine kinase [Gemmatimonadota bacterium]